ncbi:MAG: damage repair protein [bacterium]|nr:damage repair protein [bacterium]
MKERHIISIDLKSFFASVECVNRNYDPFKVPLVVADTSRGNGAMTLAVSPYLRNLGVSSRCRVFELPKNIKIIYAKPRMKLYEEYSNKILDIYKEFISEDDIHVYSIDEVFIDSTDYLKYYNKTDYEIALMIMNRIKEKTGITSTAGIGPNIFLAKVAMDIEAKHNKDCIAKWTFKDIETKLWNIEPIDKVWGIGNNLKRKLNNLGIKKVKDINNYSRDFYIKRFGNVMGNDIWSKANGIDFTTIKELNSKQKDKSMSMSQILSRDYNIDEVLLIVKEMNDLLNEKLRKMKLTTKLVHLGITYSRDFHLGFHQSISLNISTDDRDEIFNIFKYIYEKNIDDLPVRKVSIAYSRLIKKNNTQLSIYNIDNSIDNNEYYEIIDKINEKFGRTTLLRASSLLKNSTIKEREKFKNMV